MQAACRLHASLHEGCSTSVRSLHTLVCRLQPESLGCIRSHFELEIRSMERGICPIAVFYFALKRSFFNIKNVIDQQRYKCYQILGHMTSSVTLQ